MWTKTLVGGLLMTAMLACQPKPAVGSDNSDLRIQQAVAVSAADSQMVDRRHRRHHGGHSGWHGGVRVELGWPGYYSYPSYGYSYYDYPGYRYYSYPRRYYYSPYTFYPYGYSDPYYTGYISVW